MHGFKTVMCCLPGGLWVADGLLPTQLEARQRQHLAGVDTLRTGWNTGSTVRAAHSPGFGLRRSYASRQKFDHFMDYVHWINVFHGGILWHWTDFNTPATLGTLLEDILLFSL
jgi:hypothetical protein